MSAAGTGKPVVPRRVYVMHRKAWWRLTLEEWWEFVSAKLGSGSAGFPSVNLIGQPRAVIRHEDEMGTARYEPRDASVWAQVIDTWTPAEWGRAADQLTQIGMTDPRTGAMPWPPGFVPQVETAPVYDLEAYGGGAAAAPDE
jgi:hypothetical protein